MEMGPWQAISGQRDSQIALSRYGSVKLRNKLQARRENAPSKCVILNSEGEV